MMPAACFATPTFVSGALRLRRTAPPKVPVGLLFGRLHFDDPVLLSYFESWLILCCWSVDDASVFECELRSVPWADDRTVLQRAFGQRTAQVRAGMRERAKSTVLPGDQDVDVVFPRPRHRVLWNGRAFRDRRERFRRFHGGVHDADPLAVDEVASEIRGADGDGVPSPRT